MIEDIKLCHIAPINYTEMGINESDMNMVLAHIAEKDKSYAEMFKSSDKITLLDNGAFEQGYPMEADKMIGIGHEVGADILVLPDHPYKPWELGWMKVEDQIKLYKANGFKTMFIPQSIKGDGQGYMASLVNALEHPDIDFVGLSILGCPNAFPDVPEHRVRDMILSHFAKNGNHYKKFHILGMLGSVDEIKRLTQYKDLIHSWDTSAAIWYGLNGVSVKGRTKKIELAVDFNMPGKEFDYRLVLDNIDYMRSLR